MEMRYRGEKAVLLVAGRIVVVSDIELSLAFSS